MFKSKTLFGQNACDLFGFFNTPKFPRQVDLIRNKRHVQSYLIRSKLQNFKHRFLSYKRQTNKQNQNPNFKIPKIFFNLQKERQTGRAKDVLEPHDASTSSSSPRCGRKARRG